MRIVAALLAALATALSLGGCASLLGEPRPIAPASQDCAILAAAAVAIPARLYGQVRASGDINTLTISPRDLGGETPTAEPGYPALPPSTDRIDLKACSSLTAMLGLRLLSVSRFRMPEILWGYDRTFLSRPAVSPDGTKASVIISEGHCGRDWIVALDHAPDGGWKAHPLPEPRQWVCVA